MVAIIKVAVGYQQFFWNSIPVLSSAGGKLPSRTPITKGKNGGIALQAH
jgi:hypothetical protein